jgi:hypothetical protein
MSQPSLTFEPIGGKQPLSGAPLKGRLPPLPSNLRLGWKNGASTLSIMTFSIMTLSTMAINIKPYFVTLSINDTQHK